MAEIFYIGTSGWHYEDWRNRFYPEKLAKADWLKFYSEHFKTVEINNSFYRLPSENAFSNWRDSSPDNFVFAVKASRFITHVKRLKDVQEALANFLSRARILGKKLGPVLYQLPSSMQRDDDRLGAFLGELPSEIRYVIEYRHQSWFKEEVFALMRKYKVGLCIFDMPGMTAPVVATADFAYMRFHGSSGLYSSSYSDKELKDWARRLSGLAVDLKAFYVYFNNDTNAFAVRNAMTLREELQKGIEKQN